jgi:hypothetical protein
MTNVQITLDCGDPHHMADFWAAAIGLVVEDVEPGVRRMLEAGFATASDVMERNGHLVWREGASAGDPTGRLPRMYFQGVPEPKTTKNRVHLDLHVGPERRDGEVARLELLGAVRAYEGHQGPHSWITMTDPEGNEFCVS